MKKKYVQNISKDRVRARNATPIIFRDRKLFLIPSPRPRLDPLNLPIKGQIPMRTCPARANCHPYQNI